MNPSHTDAENDPPSRAPEDAARPALVETQAQRAAFAQGEAFTALAREVWIVLDAQGGVVWSNAAAVRCFGARLLTSNATPCPWAELVHPSERAKSRAEFGARAVAAQPGAPFDLTMIDAAGSARVFSWSVRAQSDARGHSRGFLCAGIDVTREHELAVTAERAGSRAQAILAGLLDPMISIDAHGTIQAASDSVERVFGYAPLELIGRNVNVLMPEPHRSSHDSYLAHYRATGETGIIGRTREFEVVRKDGAVIICALSVSRADPADGRGAVFTGTFRDITERTQAVRALAESERRYRAIFDEAFALVGLLSPDGRVLDANHAALAAIGLRREDVVGRPFWETRWWSHSAETAAQVRAAVSAAALGETVRFATRIVDHRGALQDIDFSLKPIQDASGRTVFLIPEGRNISDLKRAQDKDTAVLRSLAGIGESAALLAHEIKNPITAVNTALRAVAAELGADQRAVLEDLVVRMQRIEQIMRGTLSLAKPLALREVRCDAGQLFAEALEQLAPLTARSRALARLAIQTGGVRFSADPTLMQEVLVNLITNAIEAGGEGTRLQLTAGFQPDGGAVLAVENDGPPIPEAAFDTLFRPFATSKPDGNGLGLALSKKILEEHGGTLYAERGRTSGARFELKLPPARSLK
ncbi:MAG: PAS domain S-box protein [Planctomycetes bacterium]|nr:PAS domain S-box protein [Planctomycetota bacterium]